MEILQKVAVLVLGLVIVGAIFFMWNGMEINGDEGGIKNTTTKTIDVMFSHTNTKEGK